MEGPLKNSRHERFAVGRVGQDAGGCVPRGVSEPGGAEGVHAGHERMKCLHTKVLPRISELQQKAANKAGITRDELARDLAETCTPGDAYPAGPRIAEVRRAVGSQS